jgi:hypothetical protein
MKGAPFAGRGDPANTDGYNMLDCLSGEAEDSPQ